MGSYLSCTEFKPPSSLCQASICLCMVKFFGWKEKKYVITANLLLWGKMGNLPVN